MTTEIGSVHVFETTETDDAFDSGCVGITVSVGAGVFVSTIVSSGIVGCNGSPAALVQQIMSLLRTEHPRSPSDWFVALEKHSA